MAPTAAGRAGCRTRREAAFTTAFGGRCTFGALVTFVVAVSDITVLNIGGAFWGLLAGLTVSWLLEPDDIRRE